MFREKERNVWKKSSDSTEGESNPLNYKFDLKFIFFLIVIQNFKKLKIINKLNK